MLYCITYDIKNSAEEESFIKKLKDLGQSNQFISNCWFINSCQRKDEIFKILREDLKDADLLFITETSLSQMEGWLPTTSIEWLQQNKSGE